MSDLRIADIVPVVRGRPLTKAGRLSLTGALDGRPVKLFEATSERHARFIYNCMSDASLSAFFPAPVSTHHHFVVCEWVRGRGIKPDLKLLGRPALADFLRGASSLLEKLHAQPLTDDCGFDYIDDYIKPRFDRCCEALGLEQFRAQSEISLQKMYVARETSFCSHPDLTTANAVFRDGEMVIIDNELLGSCRLPFMDELNLLHGLTAGAAMRHPEALRLVMKDTLAALRAGQEADIFNVWLMRQTGSFYVAGHIDKVLALAQMSTADRMANDWLWITLRRLSA